jgi:molecular chaperone Hsp33
VEQTGVRGRVVRLGELVDDILTRHDYPEPVSRLLGEALALTALLGESLKFDGVLTVQAQGDGPVGLLVTSFTSPGAMRGFAQVDADGYAALAGSGADLTTGTLLGKGHLALTIDPGGDMDRYQGIVALHGESLAEAAHEYFRQSEQIATSIKLAVGRIEGAGEGPAWRAGGIMIQHLAAEGGIQDEREREARIKAGETEKVLTEGGEDVEEAWSRAAILLDTVEDHELLDPFVTPEELLYRLYHEDGVRVYEARGLSRECRCSQERSQNILRSFPHEELKEMAEDGKLSVKCEFCNEVYDFDAETLEPID